MSNYSLMISAAQRRDHVTPTLHIRNWLPVRRRVSFKTAVLEWYCAQDVLQELCVPGRPRLQFADWIDWMHPTTLMYRRQQDTGGLFSIGPQYGAVLHQPWMTTVSLSLNTLKKKLETHLFGQRRTSSFASVAFLRFCRLNTGVSY